MLWQLRTEQDPIKKEERKAKLMRETIPFYLAKFEKIVSENNGFSVGTTVSISSLSQLDTDYSFIICMYV